MPLEVPDLDIRKFEELLREAKLRIPRYTPEWTDFNESDPGITLVQLFAWLTEMMLYQMNRVPERNYRKFLQLLGMELEPAQPATAHLTFTAQAGAAVEPVTIRSQIAAQPPEGGDPLIFETEEGLDLIRVPLTDVQVFDGAAFTKVTPANETLGTPFRPLGWVPQVRSALYLGFSQTDPPAADRPFPQELHFRVFLLAETQAGQAQSCHEATQPPTPPVTLVWEYNATAEAQRWHRLNVYEDESAAFTREGYIIVQGPAEIEATEDVGKVAEPRFWLRCRLAAGRYPAGRSPEIDFIRPNTVPAVNLSTVRDEILGISEGLPDQTFELRQRPVQGDSLHLWIEVEGQEPERWVRVDDFLASKPEHPHFILDASAGVIHFGDGQRGRIPVAGADIVAREYRFGGGKAGNVGAALINTPLTTLVGVEKVTNERPAVGGADEQSVEDLKETAPHALRHRNRAVTGEDFAALAQQVGGIAKTTAVPLAHPDHPGVEVPGAVTVVIVPDTEDVPPQPSPDLIARVCEHLNDLRLLTAEIFVKGPEYQLIKVDTRVAAQPYASFDAVTRDVVLALNEYLDPKTQEFGRDLYPTSFYDVIMDVPDVRAVESLYVYVNGRPHEPLSARVIVPSDGLVYGAGHEITVVPSMDL